MMPQKETITPLTKCYCFVFGQRCAKRGCDISKIGEVLLLIADSMSGDNTKKPCQNKFWQGFFAKKYYNYRSNLKLASLAGRFAALATFQPVRYIQSAIFFNLS